jgi:hypothetical protein
VWSLVFKVFKKKMKSENHDFYHDVMILLDVEAVIKN